MNLLKYQDFLIKESQRTSLQEMMRLDQEAGLYDALNEGGAYGHLAHPFEDIGLTMGDVKDMISAAVSGAFGPENFVQEKCLHGDTMIELKNRGRITIKELVDNRYEDDILSVNETYKKVYLPILDWVNNGIAEEWLCIKTDDGKELMVTPNHRVFLEGFDVEARDLREGDKLVSN